MGFHEFLIGLIVFMVFGTLFVLIAFSATDIKVTLEEMRVLQLAEFVRQSCQSGIGGFDFELNQLTCQQ